MWLSTLYVSGDLLFFSHKIVHNQSSLHQNSIFSLHTHDTSPSSRSIELKSSAESLLPPERDTRYSTLHLSIQTREHLLRHAHTLPAIRNQATSSKIIISALPILHLYLRATTTLTLASSLHQTPTLLHHSITSMNVPAPESRYPKSALHLWPTSPLRFLNPTFEPRSSRLRIDHRAG